MAETKIIYHIDEEETPYLVKLPIPPDQVTLADFKNVLNRPSYKFFFKSMDDDFGVVKEEIVDDDAHLPCFNGRVISWLVSAESSVLDSVSQCAESSGTIEGRPSSFHARGPAVLEEYTTTETESIISSRNSDRHILHRSARVHRQAYDRFDVRHSRSGHNLRHHHRSAGQQYESSSMLSSDLESTSFVDSEEDASSRVTSTTDHTSVSRQGRHRRQRRHKPRLPPLSSRTSSYSSITDSSMSLNIITVTLNMDTVNFLGISIVGQSHQGGDGGIYVGSIMKGGAVALDGRIEPGDMILQVNDINFENMSNDDAVRVLREVVQKPGPIKLVVAKCWDPNPKGYFTIPRTEPVRPIDPGAWVAHTEAVRGGPYLNRPPSVATLTSATSSMVSSLPESERPFDDSPLTIHSNLLTIVRAMARPDSGLEVRNRLWLKITIPNAFIGSDVVDWLHTHVQGLEERRDARKLAAQLLRAGLIRHTVNKVTFSEQCYYVFGDLSSAMAGLTLQEFSPEADRDTLGPLPPPSAASSAPWPHRPYYPSGYAPIPYSYSSDPLGGPGTSFLGEGSVHSGSGSSGSDGRGGLMTLDRKPSSLLGAVNPAGPGLHGSCSSSGSTTGSSDADSQAAASVNSGHPTRLINQIPADVSGSRQSFRMAMTNPCEYFVDVM